MSSKPGILQVISRHGKNFDKTVELTESNILRQKIIASKKNKIETPLTNPPPTCYEECGELLQSRLYIVMSKLRRVYPEYGLYMFGSQIKGRSTSGHPDIDLNLVLDGKNIDEARLNCYKIVDSLSFKLDLSPISKTRFDQLSSRRRTILIHDNLAR